MTLATLLDERLREAGIPIIGVRIGRVDDRLTWGVEFASEATADQRTQAQAIINALNPADLTAAEQNKAGVTLAQVVNVLQDIAARQTQITARRAVITTDLNGLGAASTTQFKQIVGRMLSSEDNTLTAESRELEVLDRIVRALRRLV